jgi:protein-disulfide isomerase
MNIRILAIGIAITVISIVVIIGLDTNSPGNENYARLIQPENVDQAKPGGTKIDFSLFSAKATALLGSPSATVTLIEFGDYQCFHCNKFFHNTESGIEKNYIDTGKVKMIFKDFTIIGKDSFGAAHASHCANEEGKFWEYHDALYNHWTGENNGWASYDNLVEFAKQIGLDENRFEECMKDERYNSVIEENNSHAKALGIRGTPAFFIISPDGEVTNVVGSQPYEVFEKIFESVLKK